MNQELKINPEFEEIVPPMGQEEFEQLEKVIGIVEKVENGKIYTVEGNTSDSCAERQYAIGHYEILGFGIPAY